MAKLRQELDKSMKDQDAERANRHEENRVALRQKMELAEENKSLEIRIKILSMHEDLK